MRRRRLTKIGLTICQCSQTQAWKRSQSFANTTDDQDSSIALSNEEELGRDDPNPAKVRKKVDAKTKVKKVKVKTKTAADDLESR
jgi:hypothetical protein